MRLGKFLFVFVLAMSLLGVGASNANAQGPAPSLGQGKAIKEWGDAELRLLVDLAFEDKIPVPHLRAILDQLNPAQSERIGDLAAVRAGIPLDQWRKSVKANGRFSVSPLSINPPPPRSIWAQFIEKGPPAAGTRAWYYWQYGGCDGDVSDNDWEFQFSMWYSQNPDSLRWDTTSP